MFQEFFYREFTVHDEFTDYDYMIVMLYCILLSSIVS